MKTVTSLYNNALFEYVAVGKPVKKGKTDTFVLTDDEVEFLLKATIEYKKNVRRKKMLIRVLSRKYPDVLDLFVAQYRSPEEMISTRALHVL